MVEGVGKRVIRRVIVSFIGGFFLTTLISVFLIDWSHILNSKLFLVFDGKASVASHDFPGIFLIYTYEENPGTRRKDSIRIDFRPYSPKLMEKNLNKWQSYTSDIEWYKMDISELSHITEFFIEDYPKTLFNTDNLKNIIHIANKKEAHIYIEGIIDIKGNPVNYVTVDGGRTWHPSVARPTRLDPGRSG